MTAKITKLAASSGDPPRSLAEEGRRFWDAVQREYRIDDVSGVEMLTLICETLDRIVAYEGRIAVDGLTIEGSRGGIQAHPLLAQVHASRAFVVRTIAKLGLSFEPLQAIGRPGGLSSGWRG